ncbi:MAG TPA: glycosyl transferase family 51, partial [Desulfurivibrionaceae bacterium]|nr:glycosyl transferase family 51 [Desulfurivibrionaceae bacterium]
GKEGSGLYQDRQSGRYLYTGWAGQSVPAAGSDEEDVAPVQPVPAVEGWRPLSGSELAETLATLDPARKEAFWAGVLLDNTLPAETVDLLSEAVNREYAKFKDLSPYSPEVLFQTRDFKVMVGLHYIIGLCRAMGVESKLDPVLSFPLGSNVMSLLEVARVYEAILTGSVKYNGDGRHPGLAIIEAIEANDGEEIYRAERSEKKVVAPETALVVSDILRQVVKFGTGHYADDNVRLRSRDQLSSRPLGPAGPRFPVVGKTGTANRYINAAFAGGVPGLLPNGLISLSEGYVLASYVGFDDNSPMALGSTRISGAMGALPTWSGVANQIILDNDYAAKVDQDDLTFSGGAELPLAYPELGQKQVPVDRERGGLPGDGVGGGAVLLSFGDFAAGERPKPARLFKPYWLMEE